MTLTPVPGRLPTARFSGGRPDGPLVVALHGEGHDIHDLGRFADELVPAREVIAPVGCWGTYVGAMDLSNYTWFHEVPGVDEPEPVSFGRSLLDVEQLIRGERAGDGQGQPVVLLGIGQGATVALATAAVLPDALAAIIAVGGRPVRLPAGAVSAPDGLDAPPQLWLAEDEELRRAESTGGFDQEAPDPSLSVVPMPEGGPFEDAARQHIADWLQGTARL